MSDNEFTRYIKMKRAIVASAGGGLMAGMLIVGGNAYAQTAGAGLTSLSSSGMHLLHRWNSPTKIGSLANNLGLDATKVKRKIREGKGLKQILQDSGITPAELGQAFNQSKKAHAKRLARIKSLKTEGSWQ